MEGLDDLRGFQGQGLPAEEERCAEEGCCQEPEGCVRKREDDQR